MILKILFKYYEKIINLFFYQSRVLTQKKQYGEIILPLQAVMEVMQHFNSYMDIPQVKQLSDQVRVQVIFLIMNRIFLFNMFFFV